MSLVDALASRIPGAKKMTDRMGNKNISIRGRQSFNTAGNQVLWEIDGVIYNNPPSLNAGQVKYVEVLRDLAATNKYGSEGAGGVIIVKTNVSAEKYNNRKNLWNRSNNPPQSLKIRKSETLKRLRRRKSLKYF